MARLIKGTILCFTLKTSTKRWTNDIHGEMLIFRILSLRIFDLLSKNCISSVNKIKKMATATTCEHGPTQPIGWLDANDGDQLLGYSAERQRFVVLREEHFVARL